MFLTHPGFVKYVHNLVATWLHYSVTSKSDHESCRSIRGVPSSESEVWYPSGHLIYAMAKVS